MFFSLLIFSETYAQGSCAPSGGTQDGDYGKGGDSSDFYKNFFDWLVRVLRPSDPNELLGTAGYNTKRWVSVNNRIGYTIYFENDPKIATAPVHNAFIHLPVDAKMNINSLQLGEIGFGSFKYTIPAGNSYYATRLDVRDSLGLYVDITAGIDVVNKEVFWRFRSVDPATGLSPTDVLKGFLPINDSTGSLTDSIPGKGEGYVRFTLKPVSTDQTGDTTFTKASIVFDTENPIETNSWTNTIDAVPPVSKINNASVSGNMIALHWSGNDDQNGSGMKEYALYYAENGGTAILYQQHIADTTLQFEGTPGRKYSFYTIATDNTGNTEAAKNTGDLTVNISGTGTGVLVSVKALLQGPYNTATALMTDSLRTKSLLPATDPYPALGFSAVNNTLTAQINTGVFDSSGNKAVTDWVWLELRSSTNPAQILATRSALIRRDGSVVDMDGVSPVYFNNMMEGTYYVAIRHRNHLGVMTGSALSLNRTTATSIDFSSPATPTYGTDAQNNQSGTMVMWAGDANGDKRVRYNGQTNDKNAVLLKVGLNTSNNILTLYDRADVNMDGRVRYNGVANDKNSILSVLGLSTPNKVITEQIPNL